MVMKTSDRVMVVGGGAAGLICAWSLARAGVAVELIEAQEHLGGRCHQASAITVQWQGQETDFPLEHGVHAIWHDYIQVKDIIRMLGVEHNLIQVPEQGFIFRRREGAPGNLEIGRSVRESPLPTALAPIGMLGSKEVLNQPGLFFKLENLFPDALQKLLSFDPENRGDTDEVNASAFVADWPPLFQRMMTTMCRSAFFAEPEQVSLGALLTALRIYGIARKTSSDFKVFRHGIYADLMKPLADAFLAAGGVIKCGWRCTGLKVGTDGIDGLYAVNSAGQRQYRRARAVVLALDPPGLKRLCRGPLTNHIGAYAMPAGVNSLVARLWYPTPPKKEPPWTGFMGHGCADAYFWLHRFSTPVRSWHEHTGGACLELHCYGMNAKRLATVPEDAALQNLDDLVGWAWPEVGPRIAGHLQFNPPTHPLFGPKTFGRCPPVEIGIPGLSLCGDWIEAPHPSLFLERAAVTALLSARSAAQRLNEPVNKLPDVRRPISASKSMLLMSRLSRLGSGMRSTLSDMVQP